MGNEIEKLQGILQKDPSNFQARRELSILLADNGFNEEALTNFQYLLKYFPEDAEIYFNIGILEEKLKNFIGAKEAYLKAIEIYPQEDFYYNLGETQVSLEEWDEAIKTFNTVLKTDPNDGNCYFNLGLCYFNKGETNLAIDNFQKAVDLNPQDIYAEFYLGYIYENQGLTNFAIENYKKILTNSPDYTWAYYNLASIAFKKNNLEEAKEYLLKTIEHNKYDIEAYKFLTKICIKQSESEEIISILETRLNEDSNGDLYYVLAQVYKHIAKNNEYIKNLELATKEKLTLSYPYKTVLGELKYAQKNHVKANEIKEYNHYPETELEDNFENELLDEEDFE